MFDSFINKVLRIASIVTYLVFFVLLQSCSNSDNDDSSNNNDDAITYLGQSYSVNKGLEEVYKPGDNHYKSGFNISDGEFYSVQVNIFGNIDLIWRVRNGSIWIYGDLFSPGTENLSSGTFSFAPGNVDEDDPALAQKFFFSDARVVVDLNNNGDFDKDVEFFDVVDGTISVEVSGGVYTMTFNLSLENGESVKGSYSGDFTQV